MTYFWTARENVPNGIGFSLYHWQHLLWLVGVVVSVVIAVRLFARLSEKQGQRFLQGLVWLMFGMELIKDFVLVITRQFRMAYLPLDLCGLSIFLELIAVYWQNVWLRECVYSLSLPGACLALLFPNWNKLPMMNYFCLHGFLLHGLLVLVPILMLSSGRIRPRARRLPFCFVCIALACIPVALFNQRFGTNFFFLASPSKGSPLVWFEKVFGSHLIGLPVLMALIWLGMYGIPAVIRIWRRRRKQS